MAKLNEIQTSLLNRRVRLRLTIDEVTELPDGTWRRILELKKRLVAEGKTTLEEQNEAVQEMWPWVPGGIVSVYLRDGFPRYTVVTGDGKLHDVGADMIVVEGEPWESSPDEIDSAFRHANAALRFLKALAFPIAGASSMGALGSSRAERDEIVSALAYALDKLGRLDR